MGALMPFLVLLIVAVIFNFIPMDARFKQIGYVVIGIIAIVMLLRFAGIVRSARGAGREGTRRKNPRHGGRSKGATCIIGPCR